MNRKRKAIILICIAIPVIIGVLFGTQPMLLRLILGEEMFTIMYRVNTKTKVVDISVCNDGHKTINVTRVELIYLPDETLGLIWIQLRTLEHHESASFTTNLEDQLDFFNLLLEGGVVRIEVETMRAIYRFVPMHACI